MCAGISITCPHSPLASNLRYLFRGLRLVKLPPGEGYFLPGALNLAPPPFRPSRAFGALAWLDSAGHTASDADPARAAFPNRPDLCGQYTPSGEGVPQRAGSVAGDGDEQPAGGLGVGQYQLFGLRQVAPVRFRRHEGVVRMCP